MHKDGLHFFSQTKHTQLVFPLFLLHQMQSFTDNTREHGKALHTCHWAWAGVC